ncbi:serine protease easter-like isoform X1 [Bactrocera neohumeralis]|uniref:serine protease easter-like isoform X1 n=1 Tax=Bactrocera neohumeralis TaxID=98809 RepID=UPI0021662CE3|nr:serine protease easter-like isoform X1 [Bactrocera neohumeralis]
MLKPVLISVFCFAAFLCGLSSAQYNHSNETMGKPTFGRCITPNGRPGSCVILQHCKKLYSLLLNQPLHDVNRLYLSQSQCGYLNRKVLICCPDQNSTPLILKQATVKPIKLEQGFKKAVLLDKIPIESTKTRKLPRPSKCGQMTSSRIYGGNATKIDEYPWMALIEYTKPFGRIGHHCGGSLINSRYIVTASHCVNGKALPKDWLISAVRLGEWDTKTNPDCEVDVRGEKDCAPPHIDVPVESAIPHPRYDPNSLNQINDIALLRLKNAVTFTDFIRPICLPLNDNLRTATFDDIIMDVAGWGKTESKSSSNVKLKAELVGVPLGKCRHVYSPQSILLEATQMCAGGKKGVDSCRGDSGGPLIGLGTTGRGRTYYFLIGIVSFGPTSCGLEGWPGVYTRVGHFVDWIQATVES